MATAHSSSSVAIELLKPTTATASLPKTLNPNSLSFRSSMKPNKFSVRSSSSSDHHVSPSVLKRRLSSGDALYGMFLLSSSPTLAEIAGLAGYDYVVVDAEHGLGSVADSLPCLRALSAARVPSVLRLPDSSPTYAKKALDLGPDAIMFPSVSSAAEAEAAVAACRYPPRGLRGAAHPVVRASGYGTDDSYLARCEDDLMIILQVESAAAVDSIEEIANVDGVDCIQMGPLDLSASMGYLWDPGNRKVREKLREAERRVLAVTKKKGCYLGGFAMPHDPPGVLKLRGYHMVAGAVDLGMFRKAAVEDVERFRKAVTDIGEEDNEMEKPSDESYYSE
ncbi:putative 2-keto-3-deoxy-L-rhamnonate aldolase [Iris pallida]|uniref:2-keto-3-deoxy-L-rhamnonate aldolase n=1 Tax=Iris pallida TaxID=29817 RepID=A0AAX6EU11_IRIPA|nr:putative 2-keto-3-deoxy-L-rhamnonate aldolase [Iris pallida]